MYLTPIQNAQDSNTGMEDAIRLDEPRIKQTALTNSTACWYHENNN